jgi:hypothetical protein
MAEDAEDQGERLRRILREADERRAEQLRRWAAGEYPVAAYEALENLREAVPPPRMYADSWDEHIAQTIRDAVDGGNAGAAHALAEELRPGLEADAERLGNRKTFDILGGNRKTFENILGGNRKTFDILGGNRKTFENILGGNRKTFENILGGNRKTFENILRVSGVAVAHPVEFTSLIRDVAPVIDEVATADEPTLDAVQAEVEGNPAANALLRQILDATSEVRDEVRRSNEQAARDRRFARALAVASILVTLLSVYTPHELRDAIDFIMRLLTQRP